MSAQSASPETPFSRGWDAFAAGGLQATADCDIPLSPDDPGYRAVYEAGGMQRVGEFEAPVFMFAADLARPALAAELSEQYSGLKPHHLRFGAWPDSMAAVKTREQGEPIGVHLVTFGAGPERLLTASKPERRGLQELTTQVSRVVLDVLELDPATGLFVARAGKIKGPHEHVVARRVPADGMKWAMPDRQEMDLEARRAMRDEVIAGFTHERKEEIEAEILDALESAKK